MQLLDVAVAQVAAPAIQAGLGAGPGAVQPAKRLLLLQLPYSGDAEVLAVGSTARQVQRTATVKTEAIHDQGHVLLAIDGDHSHTVGDNHVLVHPQAAVGTENLAPVQADEGAFVQNLGPGALGP